MKKGYPLAARLGAVILGFESIVMLLGGLFIFGMKATPAGIEPWWGIVAGGVMAVLMIVVAGMCRFQVGIIAGWILQFVVLAGAFLNLAFVIVAAVFGGMWAYAMITSARIARQAPSAAQNTEGD
ncbi:hypothetical protein GCM10009860_02720 [Microbacterium mitrae]|uniref:DUF4233 domain-containing protein n=1 Tax=Microbacterium mitrae TaxID=664640 RepID=A0A5C8HQP1_9MICO|nr:DUF4233 domain-containing protein [Microbacterium mitrae]TXK05679.1 DUF4233 domain-containing protein [Microbacterium mitrae]